MRIACGNPQGNLLLKTCFQRRNSEAAERGWAPNSRRDRITKSYIWGLGLSAELGANEERPQAYINTTRTHRSFSNKVLRQEEP